MAPWNITQDHSQRIPAEKSKRAAYSLYVKDSPYIS